eukprot:8579136-Alexandrium_andersonii.AAC.1
MGHRRIPAGWVTVVMALVERRVAVYYRPDGASVSRPVHTGISTGGRSSPFSGAWALIRRLRLSPLPPLRRRLPSVMTSPP